MLFRSKTLRKFFTIFSLSVLVARPSDLLATHFSREKRVFGKNWVSFLTFSVFPRTFYDYLLSLSIETHPNTPCHSLQTPLLHLFTSKSSRKKVWVLILSPYISCFELHFREYLCWCFDFCYGFVSMFLGLFLFGLLRYCSYANLFRLIDSYIFLCWFS